MLLFVVTYLIYDYCACQHQDSILAFCDLNPVGIAQCNPPLRDLTDNASGAVEGLFVIPEIALRNQVVRIRHIHGEDVSEEREEFLLET
jgi:hypothetical protein